MNKWNKRFWVDLAERVGSTAIYALITLVTMDNILERPDLDVLWPILILPTLLSLLKGLAANLTSPESGASLVPAPPGPEVQEDPRDLGH